MHISFDIIRTPEPLKRKVWTFNLFGTTFVLDHYEEQYKLPPSFKWRNRHFYDRVLGRDNTLEAEQIAIPDDVEAELLETFISKLTVKTWTQHSQAGK
jgi:hypothetical protein